MPANPSSHARRQQVAELRQNLAAWERRWQRDPDTTFVTGCAGLDRLLPSHGIRQGSLIEWVGDASGAGTLSLLVGRQWCQSDRPAVLVDLKRQIYPVALSVLGFDLSTLIFVHPQSEREALWAVEESLRCKAVSLVWANLERLTGLAFRRLQLATEESGCIGFVIRPLTALKQPSWADVRLLVTPRPSQNGSPCFHVEVAYSRGRTVRSSTDIEIDTRGTLHDATEPETYRMRVVS